MREAFVGLLLFTLVLSGALAVVNGINRNIHRATPPPRFNPNAPRGKRFQP